MPNIRTRYSTPAMIQSMVWTLVTNTVRPARWMPMNGTASIQRGSFGNRKGRRRAASFGRRADVSVLMELLRGWITDEDRDAQGRVKQQFYQTRSDTGVASPGLADGGQLPEFGSAAHLTRLFVVFPLPQLLLQPAPLEQLLEPAQGRADWLPVVDTHTQRHSAHHPQSRRLDSVGTGSRRAQTGRNHR